MTEFIKTIPNYITEDNIALLSVIITILIYFFTRKYSKHFSLFPNLKEVLPKYA